MDLRAQRDRFMAFSFASADLLVETDQKGVITFAMGAASLCGAHSASELPGRAIGDLFRSADRSLLDYITKTLEAGRRVGPVVVKAANPSEGDSAGLLVSGCTLPGTHDHHHFAITRDVPPSPQAARATRDADTGLVNANEFRDIVKDTLEMVQLSGGDAKLTLLTLQGQSELDQRLDEEARCSLRAAIGALLRAASTGDAASQVSEGRYSLVHKAEFDTNQLQQDLVETTTRADPEGRGVAVDLESLDIDPDVPATESAHALSYAVRSFANERDNTIHAQDLAEALSDMMRDTSSRIAEIKSAIADKRLGFVAQPVVTLADRSVSHYELLVRFEPGRSPFEVINFAERAGIVADIDMAVSEAALDFLEQDAPADFSGLAVNLSGLSILNPAFVTRLFRLLDARDVPTNKLLFEITESAEMTDLTAAGDNINRLRKRGHQVCLDDFGSGAASFPYLRALHVDAVKIDGAYVREALQTRRDAMLLKAMASLCRDLKVVTIAEMVEREDQLRHLRGLGVEKGQGWLFGEPTPLASLRANS